jgi:hypothetical protein
MTKGLAAGFSRLRGFPENNRLPVKSNNV